MFSLQFNSFQLNRIQSNPLKCINISFCGLNSNFQKIDVGRPPQGNQLLILVFDISMSAPHRKILITFCWVQHLLDNAKDLLNFVVSLFRFQSVVRFEALSIECGFLKYLWFSDKYLRILTRFHWLHLETMGGPTSDIIKKISHYKKLEDLNIFICSAFSLLVYYKLYFLK